MRALIINAEVEREIAAAIREARLHPMSLKTVRQQAAGIPQDSTMKLADRPLGYVVKSKPQNVAIQNGYRAAISFEYQPPGLCAHLSISVDTPGRLPSPEAADMIAQAFGLEVPFPGDITKVWIEEFEPGHSAVNIVQVVKPT